jgi:hypothetical protein
MTPPFFLFRNTPKGKNQEKKTIYTWMMLDDGTDGWKGRPPQADKTKDII